MKKNNQKLIIIISFLILSVIILYAGQFLFSDKNGPALPAPETDTASSSSTDARPFPVEYKHLSENIKGNKQEIFILEFNPLDPQIEFKPVLSFDNIFGFEKISEICKRTGAYAAINGGFFYEYGDPVGMVAVDGRLLMAASGIEPVLIVDQEGAAFRKLVSEMSFEHGGNKTYINKLNRSGRDGNIVLYTGDFGSTNRAEILNTSIRIENNTVTDIYKNVMEAAIKKNSSLMSFYGKQASLPDKLGIKKGDKVNIEIKPQMQGKYQAYECGSMLVSNGEPVVPDNDRWAGSLKNRDPRTAIGIKENGNVVLIVADGRQPGYSSGLTGKELAGYLIQLGVRDAAMLDGGATSQMFVNGSLKNRPSDRGMERPVAGAFIVKVKGS